MLNFMNCLGKISLVILLLTTFAHAGLDQIINPQSGMFDFIGISASDTHSSVSDMPDTSGVNADHDVRYYTKDETNEIVEGNTFDFFLNNTNSDISAPIQYFVMDASETGDAESSFSDTITNDAFLIDTFATSTSEPTFTELVIGIYVLHIHADTTTGANVGSARLYWELWKRTHPGGVETLLITSEESNILTGIKTSLEIHGTLATDTTLASTDRLVTKVYANIETSRPTDPVVTFYAEGTTATHFEVKTTISAYDDRYVEVRGDTMTGNLIVDADVTCDTLNYTTLNPAVSGGDAAWEVDGSNDLMPVIGAFTTVHFEVDGNDDIMPIL